MSKLIAIRGKDEGFCSYCLVNDVELKKNQDIIVENDKGLFYVTTVSDVKEFKEEDISKTFSKFVRIATKDDEDQNIKNNKDEEKAKNDAIRFQSELNLNMKIINSKYTFDRKQLLFNFTADGRVDFRELAKRLAQVYKTRIELRQIGVRDKAKITGGLGPCGRFLCCSTFLNDFNTVSINMAKNQYIALNPTKINGVCGRLLCCLKYEDQQYSEMKKDFPKIGDRVNINGVEGRVSSINLFLNTVIIETKNKVFVEVDLGGKNGSSK